MISRRQLIANGLRFGVGLPLWLRLSKQDAVAQTTGGANDYKAIVCIGLAGGNDGNNMLVPTNGAEYQQYASLRGALAYPQQKLIPLRSGAYSYPLGLNPALPNIAALFNSGQASFVANVGPLKKPTSKVDLLANTNGISPSLLAHPEQIVQWQSALTTTNPGTGWGGRIADQMMGESGSLPMVLNGGSNNIFTCGNNVQGISIQGGSFAAIPAIPVPLQMAAMELSTMESSSQNLIIAQAARVRAAAVQQQLLLADAQAAGNNLKTRFPNTAFGNRVAVIAQLISGRSVIGAKRQIFYCDQGNYDTHANQMFGQEACLSELDAGIAAFMQAMQELGLSNQVLVCTQSDFNRTMQSNGNAGSDHAWGNHQLVVGGGIKGGSIIGSLPDMDMGGSQDLNTQGTWIPTLSVTQYAAGVGSWLGLASSQLSTAFPELVNFSKGPIQLS